MFGLFLGKMEKKYFLRGHNFFHEQDTRLNKFSKAMFLGMILYIILLQRSEVSSSEVIILQNCFSVRTPKKKPYTMPYLIITFFSIKNYDI
jgi:hypothetical protein